MFESNEYQLLDVGSGRKFGPYVIDRPARAAGFAKPRWAEPWEEADARFDREPAQRGQWSFRRQIAAAWPIRFGPMRLGLKFSDFGQVGLFPEQAANWNWIADRGRAVQAVEPVRIHGRKHVGRRGSRRRSHSCRRREQRRCLGPAQRGRVADGRGSDSVDRRGCIDVAATSTTQSFSIHRHTDTAQRDSAGSLTNIWAN